MKGFRHKPAEKVKQTVNWLKIGIVAICVIMALAMVLSMLGTSWLNMFTPAKPGNTALIDFTVRDAQGRPVVTTLENVYKQAYDNKSIVLVAQPMQVKVNISENKDLVPIPVVNPYNSATNVVNFGLFGPEMDQISHALLGMKVGETTVLKNPLAGGLTRQMTLDQFKNITGEMYAGVKVGDQVAIAFTDRPQVVLDNATMEQYLRTSTVTSIDTENVTINYGYPTFEITLNQLSTT